MASLTETAYLARKGINLFIIGTIAFIVLRISFGVASSIYNQVFPPKEPPPNHLFGKLPVPNAESAVATASGLTYVLETVDGKFPKMPETMRVYILTPASPGFSNFDKVKTTASKLDFSESPRKLGNTSWHFIDKDNPLRTLDIDEVTGQFRLVYNYASDLSLFNEKNFSNTQALISEGKSFFERLGLLAEDLKKGEPTVVFLKVDNGKLVTTTSLSNAEAVAVTLNREKVGKLPVVSPDQRQGNVSVILSGNGNSKKKVIEARYFYAPINTLNFGTYPVLKVADAYKKLESGKAFIASLPSTNSGSAQQKITIRNITLAYLDPYPTQLYLQPVIAFSDEKGFVAYVPAVSPEWLE